MQATIQSVKPGATSRQVNASGKAVLKRTRYGEYTPYALMHNIGCLECESPWMAEDKDYPVAEGMTVCIDVFLFRLPWGSFRIENTLAVTADGAECLTKFNRDFVARHFA
jgi:Xaa-Pro aminopeptidase